MGCGASNNTVSDIQISPNAAFAPTLPPLRQQQAEETTKRPIISEMSAGNLLYLY